MATSAPHRDSPCRPLKGRVTVFLGLIGFLIAIGVLVAFAMCYLMVNKLWSRRRLEQVAESISLLAVLLGLLYAVPFFLYYSVVEPSPARVAQTGILIVAGAFLIPVAVGRWVPANHGVPFRVLFKRSLRLERSQVWDLIKSLFRPRGAPEIVCILQRLARVDRDVDEREILLLKDFARAWKVEMPDMKAGQDPEGADLTDLRRSVETYLALDPPRDQAGQLLDVLQLFVRADEEVSEAEEIALEETRGLLQAYLRGGEGSRPEFEVLIVPQSDAQVEAVQDLIPGLELEERRGGKVFSVGCFYSRRFADVVCHKYEDLGLFATRVEGRPEAGAPPDPGSPPDTDESRAPHPD